MYSLKAPGFPIQNFESPNLDVLATLRYPCIYWIDHLHDWITKLVTSVSDLNVAGIIESFLRTRYLYWLEGLSLCRSVGKGAVSMTKLWSMAYSIADLDIIQDGYTSAIRICRTKTDLPNLLKMRGGSCITNQEIPSPNIRICAIVQSD
jgi:hypothetical protein